MLNEAATVEIDYSRFYPTLLYLLVGIDLTHTDFKERPDLDPYNVPGWDVKLVKVAVNTLINATTELSAIRAIAEKIGGIGAYDKARKLVGAVKFKNRPIAQFFGSGAGYWLMRLEADMAGLTKLEFTRQGLPILGVHDSYIVREKDEGRLLDAREERWNFAQKRIDSYVG